MALTNGRVPGVEARAGKFPGPSLIPSLNAIQPRPEVYMHPADAAECGLADGAMARVSSRRGTIALEVKVSHKEARGNCFIPFHFREAAANLLTIDEIDPVGKIPEFKFCAVKIEPATNGDGPTGAD